MINKKSKTVIVVIVSIIFICFVVLAAWVFNEIIKASEEAKNPTPVTNISKNEMDSYIAMWQKIEEYERAGQYRSAIREIDKFISKQPDEIVAKELLQRKEKLQNLLK